MKIKFLIFCIFLLNILIIMPEKILAQTKWTGACVGEYEENIIASDRNVVGKNSDVATIRGVLCLAANLLQAVTAILAFFGFAMFIYGGFLYMLSGGNTQGVTQAKQTFTYVIVGFIVAISAFIILNIISAFTGVESILTIKFLPDTIEGPSVP